VLGESRRAHRWWAATVLVAVALVVWLSRSSDTARIGAVLDEVSAALTQSGPGEDAEREARLRRVFTGAFTADARVSAPDLTVAGAGPGPLAAMAARVMQGFESTRIEPGPPTIDVGTSGREASAQLQLIASGSGPRAGTVTEVREARVALRKTEWGWRIYSVGLSAPSHDEPEARP